MKPIDYRNENFEQMRGARMNGLRADVYRAWLAHGPGTTRDVAARAGIDILNFRPRTTELFEIGALRLANHERGTEGVYEVAPTKEWEEHFNRERSRNVAGQMQLV